MRALDPIADAEAWSTGDRALASRGREPKASTSSTIGQFASARLADLRALFQAGRGAWWVAELEPGEVAGSLGIVVTGRRARYQTVDTAEVAPPAAGSARGSWSRPPPRPPRGTRSSAS